MKKYYVLLNFIFLCLVLYCPTGFSGEYLYVIEPIHKKESSYLKIDLKFQIPENGTTEIILPNSWTDADELYKNIRNIRVSKGYGKILNAKERFKKIVSSKPGELITVSYELHDNNSHPFKAHISNDYFSFIGLTAFIVPEFNKNDTHVFKINWNIDKHKKTVYKLINSYGINELSQSITTTTTQLFDSLFMGGKIQIESSALDTGNLYIVNNLDYLNTKQIKEIINYQRKAMLEKKIPFYIFSIIEFNQKNKNLFAGTNLNNATVFFCDKGFTSKNDAEKIRLYSHELFHYWLGKQVTPSTSDYLNSMWFFEGFTDYLSNLLALEAGILKFNEYIDIQNRLWKAHYSSPFNGIANREQALYYWDNLELQALPYIKGHLFAQYCDSYIKKHNVGTSSLREVITQLINMKRNDQTIEFTEDNLLHILSKILDHDLKNEYSKYFVDSKLFDPIPDLYADKAQLFWEECEIPDYGFDILQSFLKNEITGIVKGGSAQSSHLEEGYRIKEMKIDLPIRIQPLSISYVGGDKSIKHASLAPKVKKILIPQYHVHNK